MISQRVQDEVRNRMVQNEWSKGRDSACARSVLCHYEQMKESILKKYFEDKVSAQILGEDLKDSQQRTGYDTTSVLIESLGHGEFEIKKEHLIKLCKEYLQNQINSKDLNTIGFALMSSDFFFWDNETISGKSIDQVISDWDNENIGYDINRKNVQLWKEYLETGNYCLDKYELKEKFRRKGKWKKLYQEIDEILWNDWDPIEINDIAPRDEYQSYTPMIFTLKRKGANEVDIANELYKLETETIGVAGNYEHCLTVAKKIIKLNE